MKSFKEIKFEITKRLKRSLDDLEHERQAYHQKIKKALLLAVICTASTFLIFSFIPNFIFLVIGIFISISIIFIIAGNTKTNIIKSWKSTVINTLVKAIDESFIYKPNYFISENHYNASKLFKTSYDRYNGEDFIHGVYGKTELMFSEIQTEYESTSTDSKGNSSSTWLTIFDGIFMVIDFNKNFKTQLVILPGSSNSLTDFFSQIFQSFNFTDSSLVKLENPQFNKEFKVYADDQIEARYILTPLMMERIIKLKYELNTEIYLSFIDSCLYLAIYSDTNFFEPNFEVPLNSPAELEKHYYDLIDIIQIVDDLDLNTRIWTKE